jgi:hypothetical protein
MNRIRILICREDDDTPDRLTELASYRLPQPDVRALQPETALDDLEATTQDIGHAALRTALQAQWEVVDATLAEEYRQRFSP